MLPNWLCLEWIAGNLKKTFHYTCIICLNYIGKVISAVSFPNKAVTRYKTGAVIKLCICGGYQNPLSLRWERTPQHKDRIRGGCDQTNGRIYSPVTNWHSTKHTSSHVEGRQPLLTGSYFFHLFRHRVVPTSLFGRACEFIGKRLVLISGRELHYGDTVTRNMFWKTDLFLECYVLVWFWLFFIKFMKKKRSPQEK